MWPDRAVARDIVLFSTADWDHPFWTNKQHVACQLAERGFRVLYVESLGLRPPQLRSRDVNRIGRRLRRALDPLRQVRENLWVASPVAFPWHANALARWINDGWLALCVNSWRRRLQFEQPLVWTYNPLVLPLVDALDPALVVYHCVDDLRSAPHLPSAIIAAAEERLIRAADVVFTTSLALQSRAVSLNPTAAHYLPNVADFDHFAQAREEGSIPADLVAIPGPRIGFVGAVSEYKVDFGLIAHIAKARPDWHWVLIGQVGEGEHDTSLAPLRLSNVHLLGPRGYQQLPDYLRGFDVATIPCPANDYTAAMFPMKFFEYLAAGLPVVASHVPALAPFASVHERADTPHEFEAAIARVLQGDHPSADACTRIARQHTWEWRTEEMLNIVRQTWDRRHDWPTIERAAGPRAKAG
jgi:glycosyltransferase involved in cell wall biosynthesis